ncbi:MAG TPA: hypothetical protein VGG06_04975 [Thermoanaerobaculia bacterium]|jgi:hypothetical protein
MATRQQVSQSVIGQVALRMARLPYEHLPLVLQFLDTLEKRLPPEPEPASVDAILAEALEGAELLRDVPRGQLLARFMELGEEIRQEVIAKGTAIDGDYTGD